MKTLDWFTDRIGKRVYRDKSDCDCQACTKTAEEGIIIKDEQHADYLYLSEAEGVVPPYRDEQ